MDNQSYSHQIVIVGGGSGGITTAAQFLLKDKTLDIAIIEPSQKHYYQPGWTLASGGLIEPEKIVRDKKDVMPKGVHWIKDYVTTFNPNENSLTTKQGTTVKYQYLILSPGGQLNLNLIKGLKETLGKNGVTSNYAGLGFYSWELIKNFKGGTAIFTYPATAIKCGGAAQKVMYMADATFKSKSGVGVNSKVMFCTAGTRMFGVKEYSDVLNEVVERQGIETKYQHNLKEIKADTKEAIFDVTTENGIEEVTIKYDILHVAPPMSAPDFIKESPFAEKNGDGGGWVEVDKYTLQHKRYSNVFGLGDASSLPTSKTAAAVRGQVPVVVENLLALMKSQPLTANYDGYTCCPIITSYHSVVLAEFDYEGKPISSFFINLAKERYSMFLVKRYLLPWLYWNRMLKGKPFETAIFKKLGLL
ncbi:MAG: NAD(P)/FAD-dependent oxidoreductase [Cyanobacteria bacterium]|nr:NAD(P)/FAD-dependent oxidoreductase [Cyanobacteria bacterium CG_2015-16_32_12]NCO76777.1 NAD(P)/FAD-dependent oxidoreductase [Cyanobacteria bacterium CG_2015-22_32_23]NCQ04013.1 NAD(P)/FAD-dependent oxidoreductase [Cyanobacteria bacterium CG_2015-09_32_10]NCQ43070.1 NAD(P)/FAD-dependent oxidoreductase [Cyanobacteria bacterium CG_2015-04_32_10]NCS84900.1 NAD(P)/FAD-dependent oxidoreductase [Cyanobacteria bacterium CG_2015-02_32_10]